MSAAATAAGYLYASGRLRGRSKDEPESREEYAREARHDAHADLAADSRPAARALPKRRPLRVAALPEPDYAADAPRPQRARPAVKVEYRTRRWRPGGSVD